MPLDRCPPEGCQILPETAPAWAIYYDPLKRNTRKVQKHSKRPLNTPVQKPSSSTSRGLPLNFHPLPFYKIVHEFDRCKKLSQENLATPCVAPQEFFKIVKESITTQGKLPVMIVNETLKALAKACDLDPGSLSQAHLKPSSNNDHQDSMSGGNSFALPGGVYLTGKNQKIDLKKTYFPPQQECR